MESEKVKEIKKVLKYCCGDCDCDCPFYKNGKSYEECKSLLLFEALTLINELESKNERLSNALEDNVTAYEDGFQDGASLKGRIENKWVKENKQLKDRIAELEKENDELKVDLKNSIDMQKQMLDGFKTATKEVEENLAREIPNLLKQFAERLKDRLRYTSSTSDVLELKGLVFDGIEVEQSIDETLKEFINGSIRNEY